MISFGIPNKDTYISPFILCPKEVLQKGYKDSIGKQINYLGEKKTVKDVRITDDFIYVDLID